MNFNRWFQSSWYSWQWQLSIHIWNHSIWIHIMKSYIYIYMMWNEFSVIYHDLWHSLNMNSYATFHELRLESWPCRWIQTWFHVKRGCSPQLQAGENTRSLNSSGLNKLFKPELLRERNPRPQHCRVAALHAAGAVGCEQATNAVHEEYDEIIQMQGKPRLIPTWM